MARSKEALQRRAKKRQRTEEEQRASDSKDIQKRETQEAEERAQTDHKRPNGIPSRKANPPFTPLCPIATTARVDPTAEVGAWTCTSCHNLNYASRVVCNSKTCDERRPSHLPPAIPISARTMPNAPATPTTPNRNAPPSGDLEEGAWHCPSCGNHNYASRAVCNSKTCREKRPKINAKPSSHATVHTPTHTQPQSTAPLAAAPRGSPSEAELKEPGAWHCGSCGNDNYASRAVCNSKTCHEKRPKSATRAVLTNPAKRVTKSSPRNPKPSTKPKPKPALKPLQWAKQADESTLVNNEELRAKFTATGGVGMSDEDVERAKLLLARSARKRQKKNKTKLAVTKRKIGQRSKHRVKPNTQRSVPNRVSN